jgi:hypothetical protein
MTLSAVQSMAKKTVIKVEQNESEETTTVSETSSSEAPAFRPFFVYTDDGSKENNFSPSGWMGDISDIKFSGSYQANPQSGKTCLRIMYLARGSNGWAGIYWQSAANNWGTTKTGYDLRGAKVLTFWARGENDGERISEFKLGGISGRYPDSDVAWIGPIKLTPEWKQYSIPLKKKDLRYINGGFCFSVMRQDNPDGCTIYLDEIRFE